MAKTVIEYCPYCEQEVKIKAEMFILQKCPHCKKPIRACSLCDCDICDCSACEKKYK